MPDEKRANESRKTRNETSTPEPELMDDQLKTISGGAIRDGMSNTIVLGEKYARAK